MQFVEQHRETLLANLSALDVDWMDKKAESIMERIKSVPEKKEYDRADIAALIDAETPDAFEVSLFCVGLFLGHSKDKMTVLLNDHLGPGGIGIKRYRADRQAFIDALEELGLRDAMTAIVNTKPLWSDLLKERLRYGRGSAIQGQQRGRGLEDFTEDVIKSVFGSKYETRCTFSGARGPAKCDFAIPDKHQPRILVESKGYGATGSKMSDIIGDLDAIISAKRHDTSLLFITDGLTWKARANDLRKIIQRQNKGEITRIYTKLMRDQFEADLRTLKHEYGL